MSRKHRADTSADVRVDYKKHDNGGKRPTRCTELKNVIPNLTGYAARYTGTNPYSERTDNERHRDVIGFDELGYPLVQCGGRLVRADKAKFEHYSKYIGLSLTPDGSENVVYEAVYDAVKLVAERGELETAQTMRVVYDAVRDVAREMMHTRQKQKQQIKTE